MGLLVGLRPSTHFPNNRLLGGVRSFLWVCSGAGGGSRAEVKSLPNKRCMSDPYSKTVARVPIASDPVHTVFNDTCKTHNPMGGCIGFSIYPGNMYRICCWSFSKVGSLVKCASASAGWVLPLSKHGSCHLSCIVRAPNGLRQRG